MLSFNKTPYDKMYLHLFNEITDVLLSLEIAPLENSFATDKKARERLTATVLEAAQRLKQAQQATEDMFLER